MRRPSATTKPCFLSTMILSPSRTSRGIQVYSLPVSTSVSGNDRAGSRRSRFWISIVVRMSPTSSTVAPSLRSAETISLLSASNLCEERQHTVTFPGHSPTGRDMPATLQFLATLCCAIFAGAAMGRGRGLRGTSSGHKISFNRSVEYYRCGTDLANPSQGEAVEDDEAHDWDT